jgi:Putative beta-barrel porin-2, OmpL-like. bbp2
VTDGNKPNESWEIGVSAKIMDTSISMYHYRLESLRNLTGVVVERTIGPVDFGFNFDYWRWDGAMADLHADDSSIGGAFYVVSNAGNFSFPVRLEYIDQGKSAIYLDCVDAHHIYAATVSPTYKFNDNTYIRADLAYVHADDGFADSDGNLKNDRICLAAEVGYTF